MNYIYAEFVFEKTNGTIIYKNILNIAMVFNK